MKYSFGVAIRSKAMAVALGCGIASTLMVGVLASGNAVAQSKPPIKLGIVLPLSRPIGASTATGVKMAVKEINDAGGILGRRIELVLADDQADPTQAVNETKRLVQLDKVDAIYGPISSQLGLAMAPTLNEGKVASLAPLGSSLLSPKATAYFFSQTAPVDAAAVAMIEFAEKAWKVKSIGVISDSGSQSKDAVATLRREATARNIRFEAQEYAVGSTDVVPQLLSLRGKNPDALLFIAPTGEDMGQMVRGTTEIGWKVRMLGNNVVSTAIGSAIKIAGMEPLKGIYGIAANTAGYCPNDAVGSGTLAKVAEKVKAFEPANFKNLEPLVPLVAYGYEGPYILKAAMEGSGKTDGPSVAAWLEQNAGTIRNNLVYGPVSANKTAHHLRGTKSMVIIVDGVTPRSDGLFKRADCDLN